MGRWRFVFSSTIFRFWSDFYVTKSRFELKHWGSRCPKIFCNWLWTILNRFLQSNSAQLSIAKIGTKSEFKAPLEGFFSNSKSHSQPIRIEHQLSLNWTRNSITKVAAALVGGWASRLKITNNVMLWYPYRRHLSHSSTVKQLEGLKVITHLIIIIKFNLIYFWGGLVIMSPFFPRFKSLLLFFYANFELF